MKKFCLLLVALLPFAALAQCPTDLLISDQATLDNFVTNNPGCTDLPGNLVIEGGDIVDLSSLSALASVGGGITIRNNPLLATLTGLGSVVSVGSSVVVTCTISGALSCFTTPILPQRSG